MQNQRQNWDTRAWLIAIVGGSLSGGISAWSGYPPIQRHLDSMPHFAFIGRHSADVISGFFGFLSLLVLPGLLSGLSRKVTFLWGIVPLLLFLVSMDLEDWCESGLKSVVNFWWPSLAIAAVCWLISSGPVSLIRWLRVRAKRRQEAVLASYHAMREMAAVPHEGVWPPPPEYKG